MKQVIKATSEIVTSADNQSVAKKHFQGMAKTDLEKPGVSRKAEEMKTFLFLNPIPDEFFEK